MSRVGKDPINVPKTVKIAINQGIVNVEGPKGKLNLKISDLIKTDLNGDVLTLSRATNQIKDRSLHGTSRTVIANMIKGVTDGYSKELGIEGVGFKAAVEGKKLNLSLGFTHPVIFDIPEGLTVEAPKPVTLIVKGIDKVKVGLFAAKIRKVYEAEPYKGKGVRYAGEVVRRKAGKTVTK